MCWCKVVVSIVVFFGSAWIAFMNQKQDNLSESRLVMRGIHKSFGATKALCGVDIEVRGGEVLALIGENGAGKSTLMKVLSGAHQADSGEMFLEGEKYWPRHPLDARHRGVAMIYQELSLAPDLSVAENVMLGMEPSCFGFVKRGQMRAVVADALEQLGHPGITPETIVSELTIGAQQLVEIARAIAVGCKVLVLDEPTSSLGKKDVELLFDLIDRLKAKGHAIVYISHFLEEVERVSDRFEILRDGQTVGGGVIGEVSTDEIISMMVGRDVKELYPRSERQVGEVVMSLKDFSGEDEKSVCANLELRGGEVLGISGLVGAGRTEMLRAVFGLDAIASGEVKVGAYCGGALPRRRWDQGVGLVSENRKEEGLALSMSIADNLTLTNYSGMGPWGLIMPGQQIEIADRESKRLAVKCRDVSQPIGDLSGGNQQKVAILRLLHHDVDIYLLDEPTRGIDVGSKAQIYQLIDDLAVAGKAVLLVSSYLPELLGVCDRIAVMYRGQLGQAKAVGEIDEHAIMLEATGKETVK